MVRPKSRLEGPPLSDMAFLLLRDFRSLQDFGKFTGVKQRSWHFAECAAAGQSDRQKNQANRRKQRQQRMTSLLSLFPSVQRSRSRFGFGNYSPRTSEFVRALFEWPATWAYWHQFALLEGQKRRPWSERHCPRAGRRFGSG